MLETRTDNNLSEPTTRTIDGRKRAEEKIKRYWSSVKFLTEEETIDNLDKDKFGEFQIDCESRSKDGKSKARPALSLVDDVVLCYIEAF